MKAIDKSLFRISHKELELLVVDFKMTRDIVTDVYERYLVYEACRRHIDGEEPFNIKWVQSTLKLSFPKVQSIVRNLIENGYLAKKKSQQDRRITFLLPTKKLIQGLLLFEDMKMNELFRQKIKVSKVKGKPSLSELSIESKEKFKKLHLDQFF